MLAFIPKDARFLNKIRLQKELFLKLSRHDSNLNFHVYGFTGLFGFPSKQSYSDCNKRDI